MLSSKCPGVGTSLPPSPEASRVLDVGGGEGLPVFELCCQEGAPNHHSPSLPSQLSPPKPPSPARHPPQPACGAGQLWFPIFPMKQVPLFPHFYFLPGVMHAREPPGCRGAECPQGQRDTPWGPPAAGSGSPAAPYTRWGFSYSRAMLGLRGKTDREMEEQYKYLVPK